MYKALRGGVQDVAVKVLPRTSGRRLQRLIDVRPLGLSTTDFPTITLSASMSLLCGSVQVC